MKILQALQEKKQAAIAKMQALTDAVAEGDWTDEQKTEFDAAMKESDTLSDSIARRSAALKAKAEADTLLDIPVIGRAVVNDPDDGQLGPAGKITVPATAKRWTGQLKAFKGPNADVDAYSTAMWLAALVGRPKARKWCSAHGIGLDYLSAEEDIRIFGQGQSTGDNAYGGYVVLPQFETAIYDLKIQYGVFRPNAGKAVMTGETWQQTRRKGGLESHFVGEGQAPDTSRLSWDNISLVAKRLATLSFASREWNEDTYISWVDEFAVEVAASQAQKEDDCGFNGDGTAAYGRIYGVLPQLLAVNGVDDGGGLILASGNLWSEIALADFNRMMGRVPHYANRLNDMAWYCSKAFAHSVMYRLAAAAGGATPGDVIRGVGMNPPFLAYPVHFTEVLASEEDNSQIACLFGSLSMAAKFGDRRATTIEMSRDATVDGVSMFTTHQIALMATERFDENVHNIGSATEAGPIVGLITQAS